MEKYKLTEADIQAGINRFLANIYASAVRSDKPVVEFIVGGPGAGKTGVEIFLKEKLRKEGEKAVIIGSDKIAEYHPDYEELMEELTDFRYKKTREFVRPAAEKIYKEVTDRKISILNEQVFNKGKDDLDFVKNFKDKGYKINVNIIATDIYVSKLACFERESLMLRNGESPRQISSEDHKAMYNVFLEEVKEFQRLGLLDQINVYKRGKSINKPELIYSSIENESRYRDFEDAINVVRSKQRDEILDEPITYLNKLNKIKRDIEDNGYNPEKTKFTINEIEMLEQEIYGIVSEKKNGKGIEI